MTKFRFTPEHFSAAYDHTMEAEEIARQANAILDAEREKMPVVYGQRMRRTIGFQIDWERSQKEYHTHRARLWDIEEVEGK